MNALNTIITGTGSVGAAPNAVLAQLPDSSRELGFLLLFGLETGHLDSVALPELALRKEGAFACTTNGSGTGSVVSSTNVPTTVTGATGGGVPDWGGPGSRPWAESVEPDPGVPE